MMEISNRAFINVSYEREGFHNYLVVEPKQEVIPFEIKMINNQKHLRLLPVQYLNECLYYEVQGKELLEEVMKQQCFNAFEMLIMLLSIVEMLKQLDEYMLLADSVVLDSDLLYVDKEKNILYPCYIPGYQGNIQQEFRSFIEFLMNRINHLDEALVVLIYGIYHITKEDHYSLHKVEEFLMEKEKLYEQNERTVLSHKKIRTDILEETDSEMQSVKDKEHIQGRKGIQEMESAEIIKTDEAIGQKEKTAYIHLLQYQMGKWKQQRILYGTITLIMFSISLYVMEATFVIGSIANSNIFYALLIVLTGAFGSFFYTVLKVKKIRKEIRNYSTSGKKITT